VGELEHGRADSVARTLEIVGDRWTFLILREAFFGVRRFSEFRRRLGIARNVLVNRLNRLVEHGILERRRYSDRHEREEYRLTEKGLDLHAINVAYMRWGDRWLAGEAGPPLRLFHDDCGGPIGQRLYCEACGDDVGARDTRYEPGPGALDGASVGGTAGNRPRAPFRLDAGRN
jgi:DNA-binding HxlR family transcriptional regulator